MKHSYKHENTRSAGVQRQPVRFEFTHLTAATVAVAGTFNDWHPSTKSMHSIGSGHWLKEMALTPGAYEYCFVVDGQWLPDPLAGETVPNPFGGRNSVLKVANTPEAAHRADAANSPLKSSNKPKAQRP